MKKQRKTRHNLHTKDLFNRIRERLKLTKNQLSNNEIKEYYKFLNPSLLSYIMDNPEGFQMTIGGQLNGVLVVSKHLPKEMREDKFEKLEEIEAKDIPEYRKKIYRKRYATALNRRIAYESVYKESLEPVINSHSFFYSYKFMWFNKRNCKIRKTSAWQFEVNKKSKDELERRIRQGEDFFELNFDDFYHFRIKPIN